MNQLLYHQTTSPTIWCNQLLQLFNCNVNTMGWIFLRNTGRSTSNVYHFSVRLSTIWGLTQKCAGNWVYISWCVTVEILPTMHHHWKLQETNKAITSCIPQHQNWSMCLLNLWHVRASISSATPLMSMMWNCCNGESWALIWICCIFV